MLTRHGTSRVQGGLESSLFATGLISAWVVVSVGLLGTVDAHAASDVEVVDASAPTGGEGQGQALSRLEGVVGSAVSQEIVLTPAPSASGESVDSGAQWPQRGPAGGDSVVEGGLAIELDPAASDTSAVVVTPESTDTFNRNPDGLGSPTEPSGESTTDSVCDIGGGCSTYRDGSGRGEGDANPAHGVPLQTVGGSTGATVDHNATGLAPSADGIDVGAVENSGGNSDTENSESDYPDPPNGGLVGEELLDYGSSWIEYTAAPQPDEIEVTNTDGVGGAGSAQVAFQTLGSYTELAQTGAGSLRSALLASGCLAAGVLAVIRARKRTQPQVRVGSSRVD